MATEHRVQKGESLYTIAEKFGFLNWRTIYDAPENQSLRERRPNPHILHPGDVVMIPDTKDPSIPVPLDTRTVLVKRKRGLQPLHILLRREDGSPHADRNFQLTFQGGEIRGKTDARGLLREELPVKAAKAELKLGTESRTLLIGFLNPLEDTSDKGIGGAQGRLKNLGFYHGPLDGTMNDELKDAILLFQNEHSIAETGELDKETMDMLLEVHGS